jgi:small conductance mechanosensitive channel
MVGAAESAPGGAALLPSNYPAMPWHRYVTLGAVLLASLVVARLVDRAIARRGLDPAQATRYRVVRRTIAVAVLAVGVLSALLVIPQVRAVAGGILASSAVIAIVIGFASQRTLGNFIAGLLIAFTQPLRLGDRVEIGDDGGVVEEIGLTYTFIRTDDDARVVIPNEKLASDTIRNSTIRSRETLAEITVQVPLKHDLTAVIELLRRELPDERSEVFVSSLEGAAALTLRASAPGPDEAERLASDLRLRVHERLRDAGVFT